MKPRSAAVRNGKGYLILVAASVLVILLLQWNPVLWASGDNAVYMNLGRALFEGCGFVQLCLPDHPPDFHVMPGYPAILAGLMAIAGNPKAIILFKLFSTLCSVLFLVLLSRLFERHLEVPAMVSVFMAVYLALLPQVAMLACSVMTEAPFMLLSVIALALLFRYLDFGKYPALIGAALLSGIAVYVRFAGFPLIIALFLGLLFAKRFKGALLYAAISCGVVAPWLIHILKRGEITYLAQSGIEKMAFGDILLRVMQNLWAYVTVRAPMLFAPWGIAHRWLEIALGMAIFLLVVVGVVLSARDRKARIMSFLVLCFAPVLLLFHSSTTRYLVPIAAPVLYLIYLTIRRFGEAISQKARRYAFAGLLVILTMLSIVPFADSAGYTSIFRKEFRGMGAPIDAVIASTPETKAFYDALFWVKDNTPQDAVLISSELRLAYFISDRPGVYIGAMEGDEIWRKGLSSGATHLIIDMSSPILLEKLISAARPHSDCFSMVYSTEKAQVFEIDSDRLGGELDR